MSDVVSVAQARLAIARSVAAADKAHQVVAAARARHLGIEVREEEMAEQRHRAALTDAGLRRWEIGEIASRVGQLYYAFYLRTGEGWYLSESHAFFDAAAKRDRVARDDRGDATPHPHNTAHIMVF